MNARLTWIRTLPDGTEVVTSCYGQLTDGMVGAILNHLPFWCQTGKRAFLREVKRVEAQNAADGYKPKVKP